jgi:hypothetical protein
LDAGGPVLSSSNRPTLRLLLDRDHNLLELVGLQGEGQRRTLASYAHRERVWTQVVGYSVLECIDLEQAIEVSSRHPTAKIGTFELGPFLEWPRSLNGELRDPN